LALQAHILPERAVVYEQSYFYAYYRLDATGRFLMGGRSWQRDTSDPAAYVTLTAYAQKLFPALTGVSWTHVWNGRVAITADHLPHLHRPEPGLSIGLGYNGRGVAMATAMGRQLALSALGAEPEDLALPVTTIRPMPLHRLWPLGVLAERIKNGLLGRLQEG
jgi:glycine/D-amino acid oxidase-like deaminating enzyme